MALHNAPKVHFFLSSKHFFTKLLVNKIFSKAQFAQDTHSQTKLRLLNCGRKNSEYYAVRNFIYGAFY